MTEEFVKEKVNEYFSSLYGVKYIGKILYKEEDQYNPLTQQLEAFKHYKLTLSLNNLDKPLNIQGQFFSDERFLNFIQNEIKERQLHRTQYFSSDYGKAYSNQSPG